MPASLDSMTPSPNMQVTAGGIPSSPSSLLPTPPLPAPNKVVAPPVITPQPTEASQAAEMPSPPSVTPLTSVASSLPSATNHLQPEPAPSLAAQVASPFRVNLDNSGESIPTDIVCPGMLTIAQILELHEEQVGHDEWVSQKAREWKVKPLTITKNMGANDPVYWDEIGEAKWETIQKEVVKKKKKKADGEGTGNGGERIDTTGLMPKSKLAILKKQCRDEYTKFDKLHHQNNVGAEELESLKNEKACIEAKYEELNDPNKIEFCEGNTQKLIQQAHKEFISRAVYYWAHGLAILGVILNVDPMDPVVSAYNVIFTGCDVIRKFMDMQKVNLRVFMWDGETFCMTEELDEHKRKELSLAQLFLVHKDSNAQCHSEIANLLKEMWEEELKEKLPKAKKVKMQGTTIMRKYIEVEDEETSLVLSESVEPSTMVGASSKEAGLSNSADLSKLPELSKSEPSMSTGQSGPVSAATRDTVLAGDARNTHMGHGTPAPLPPIEAPTPMTGQPALDLGVLLSSQGVNLAEIVQTVVMAQLNQAMIACLQLPGNGGAANVLQLNPNQAAPNLILFDQQQDTCADNQNPGENQVPQPTSLPVGFPNYCSLHSPNVYDSGSTAAASVQQ
ncbi:hypothetical protein M422DRAFT_56106 [Sphaerobolus stellatus SS14]|uniref:Uncharacterized protein n=1 Tax=Sphaerobolus stellatus (strain SS14) TaxID=990650 RepID=A0A0C9U7V6_SPHS4|nr:hypothetical protein M422DRAFT_56106 [Sphaerobolus stellatus SS14]